MKLKKLFYALVLSGTALGLAACGMGTSSSPGAGSTQLLPDGGLPDGGGSGGSGGGPMGW
jgi:hypothetical protein